MITIQVDTKIATRWLNDLQRKQIPFAVSLALNKTASDIQEALAKKTAVFDRPKPLTKKGTYIARATKIKWTAVVGLKTRSKGGPVDEYLAAEIAGGAREDKRSEILLQKAGIMPPGFQTRPGSGARLDAYGNMSRGQIVQILSYFRAFGGIATSGRYGTSVKTASTKINRGARRPSIQYFVVPQGYAGLSTGIWKRQGSKIEPILIFIKPPTYRKKYDFYSVAFQTMLKRFDKRMEESLAYALGTAR